MNNKEIIKRYVNEWGLSLIKIKAGDKEPVGKWKDFQTRKLKEQEIIEKFDNVDELRIAIVCGKISGNLELIDIDNKFGNVETLYPEYLELPGVMDIIKKCVVEKSMSGGLHIYYRCNELQGNMKLAEWPTGKKNEKGKELFETVFETRGEGGYVLCAPSKGYELIQGGFENIPFISNEDRETLLSASRSFDRKVTEVKPIADRKKYKNGTPWDLYSKSESAIEECKKLLIENGWKRNGQNDKEEYWLRPGKNDGVSASYRDNSFGVFSTNAGVFDSNRSYLPASVYALLKYGEGKENFKKAIDDFIVKGFGERSGADIGLVETHLDLLYDFRLNIVTGMLEMKLKAETEYKNAEDYDTSSIFREMQHKDINYSYERLNNLLNSDFVPRYDPFKEYFEGLPVWDGTDYIKELSDTIKLTDESKRDYWYTCLRRWLIALTACATEEDITNEVSPIFYGLQGKGKTKWLNRIVPTALDPKKYLFVGTINDDKDSKLHLSSKFIINLDELGSLNKDEIGYLKSLYSLTHITIREPYMRKSRALIRRASFAGSIDREEFLTDLSGTRRFLTFSVSELDYQHQVDMDKVYAQAYTLFKQGERFYFNEDEIKEVNMNNEDFRIRPIEEELFFRYFEKRGINGKQELLTTTEIAHEFAEIDNSYRMSDASIRKIGQLLNKEGFSKGRKKRGSNYVYAWDIKRVNRTTFAILKQKTPEIKDN
ncbi:VapE domain-containing protein [Clostridium sp.]|uniref:VapE domain-containing protein n=1 Tax=Clostridium sp. TaxID=1506 RepID=UPI0028481C23|nr:VapE domain-containing protein [Clostridium sp.]MDR3596515.1 VapE family protein [Clostridium sp.]